MNLNIEYGQFANKPTMTIIDNDPNQYKPSRIGFGKKKAQMILANIEAIRVFASDENTDIAVPRVPAVPTAPSIPLPPRA